MFGVFLDLLLSLTFPDGFLILGSDSELFHITNNLNVVCLNLLRVFWTGHPFYLTFS